jgi:hypothetical protein
MADLYYIEEDYYNPSLGYFVYTADAAAAPTVITSVDCVAEKIATGAADFTASFTQTVTISHIHGSDLFAFTEAAIAVQVDRIRGNNIAATSVFNIATSVERIQQGDADADAIFSAIINGLRSRDVNLETQAAFSFDCVSDKIKLATSSINVEVSFYCDPTEITPFINGEAYLNSEFTTSADISKIIQLNVALEATTSFTATISHIEGADLTAFASSNISITVERLRNNNSDISSSSSLSSGIELTKLGSSDITSTSSISCVISHIHGADIEVQNFASISAQAQATLNGVVAIQSQVDTFIDGDAIRDTVITTTSAFTSSVSADTFKGIQSNHNVEVTFTSSADRLRDNISSQTSTATLTASAIVVKDAHLTAFNSITLNVNATITAQGAGSLEVLSSIGFNGGKRLVASSTISLISILKGAVDRGIVMRPLFGLASGNTAGSGTGRAGDSIVNNALYITKSTSSSGSAGIISTLPQANVFTISDAYNLFSYSGQFDVSIRFKIRVQNATSLDKFIYAGNLSSGNYWAISYGTNATRAFTFTSYDTSRATNALYSYTGPSQTTDIYNTWLDIEFYSASANRTGLSGTQNYCYFVINGVSSSRLESIIPANGGYTEQFFGTNLPSASLVIRNNTVNNPFEIDDVQINIKQNQNYGSRTDNQFRKVYLPFTGNYYDWNSAVQQTAQSAITSQASLQGTISGPQKATANISAVSSLSAIIGKVQEINLVAFDDAELTVAAGRIQQGAVAIQSSSSVICDAAKKIDNNVSATGSSSQTVIADRIRNVSVITESIFSELVVGKQLIGVIAHLTNRFYTDRPYVDGGYVGEGYAEVYDTTAVKTASGVANLNVNATLTASATTVAEFALLVMSAGTMTVDAVKTTNSVVSSSVVSSVETAASKTAVSQQALSAVFTTSIKGDKSGDIALYAFTNATLNIQPDIFRITGASLTTASTFYFDSSGALFQQADAAVNVSTTVNVSGNRVRFGVITTEAIASELVVVVKTTAVDVDMVVNSTLTVEATKFKIVSCAISVSTSQSTTAIKTARGTSAISSAMTFDVSYRDLRIDEIEYRIPAEGWTYSITGETRLHSIVGETRLRKITEETAIKPVASETRIHIID